MDINEMIGERIQRARLRHGWNQSELARRVGKPRQHISQIEQGKQQPRAELLIEMAKLLGVSTDYLFGLQDEEAAQPATRQRTRKTAPVA